MKKICVVTGSRAEYGLLKWLIEGIKKSPKLKLQLIVTGAHLLKKFGETINIIYSDNFKIDYKVNMPLFSDSSEDIIKSMGEGMKGFSKALTKLKPDAILVLGDRYEVFVAATSAMIANIPIIHLHGGESTEGVIDEAIRHSITKMSHLHFVAAEEYKKRVIQLGEKPNKIYNVGGLGVDSICKLKLLSQKELENKINFKFLDKNLLITFHPVVLGKNTSKKQIEQLFKALLHFDKMGLIFTMPNADKGNNEIFKKINNFCKNNKNAKCYASLGHLQYLSCIQYVNGVVGNSSSGLLEVPTFKKGTINIGDRQHGRLKAKSVIDCDPQFHSILLALNKLFSKDFQKILTKVKNPYGKGGSSSKIVKILEKQKLTNLLTKEFHNL